MNVVDLRDRLVADYAGYTRSFIKIADPPKLQQALEPVAAERAANQLAAHERVREAPRAKGRVTVQPILPVDILGAYVLLPGVLS